MDEYKKFVCPKKCFQKKNSKCEILNHFYFGPNFVFLETALGRFSQCFFKDFSSSANHGGRHFYSVPPPTIKKLPTALSLHKNVIISLLCQCGLFINTCVSKNSIVLKDLIFYLLWYNVIRWRCHICKKSSFFLIL